MSKKPTRIGLSAHYTSYVWLKHGLSYPQLSTLSGRLIHLLLAPINAFFKVKGGANIDTFLLQRHKIIDAQLEQLIEEQGVAQILELGAGLSPRGLSIATKYPHIQYIETDLEPMVKHKTKLIQNMKIPCNLTIKPCSFIATSNQPSIVKRLKEFDTQKPTLVISEGLINYFSKTQLQDAMQTMTKAFKPFSQGYYLTDIYPNDVQHPSYRYLKLAQRLVSKLTATNWFLHYKNEEEIAKAFIDWGVAQCQVINPSSLSETNLIEPTKTEPLVRIVLNRII